MCSNHKSIISVLFDLNYSSTVSVQNPLSPGYRYSTVFQITCQYIFFIQQPPMYGFYNDSYYNGNNAFISSLKTRFGFS